MLELIIDGTERRITRPQDKEERKQYYSGKKKTFTVKNLVITQRKGKVLYLSDTYEGKKHDKAIHLALGVNLAGTKELLGLWITPNESAKFWLSVLTELQNRGVKDILIACVDGLTGFPDAIEAVFPKTTVQLCIVHLVRNSLSYVSYKDRKAVAADLRLIYTAATEAEAEQRLVEFAETWDKQSPTRPQVLDDPLESHHSLLCLPRRNSQSHLHHQHD